MALNLRQTVTDFLKAHPEERFTARELANWIFENLREPARRNGATASRIFPTMPRCCSNW